MKDTDQLPARASEDQNSGGRGGHGWMMVVCSIPILIVAAVVLVTGVATVGFLFAAALCTVMMAVMMVVMMRGMNHGRSGG